MRWNVLVLVVCSLFLISFASAAIPADCDANMVSYWKFDTTPLGADDGLNLNDGVLDGAVAANDEIAVLGSLFSSQVANNANVPHSSTLVPFSGLTLNFWFSPSAPLVAAMPFNSIIKKTGYNFSIALDGSLSSYVGDVLLSSPATYVPNTKYFITMTWDGSNAKLYVNGTLEDTKPLTSITYGTDPLTIGEGYVGYIDEFAIYNRSLTQAEITKHFTDSSDGKDYCYKPSTFTGSGEGSTTQVNFSIFGCTVPGGEQIPYGGCSSDGLYYCDRSASTYFDTIESPGMCKLYADDMGGNCCPTDRECVVRGQAEFGDGSYGEDEYCYPRLQSCSSYDDSTECGDHSCCWIGSSTDGICYNCNDPSLSCSVYTSKDPCEEDRWDLGQNGAGTDVCGTFVGDKVIPTPSCECVWDEIGGDDWEADSCVLGRDITDEFHDGNPETFKCLRSTKSEGCIEGEQFMEWTVRATNPQNFLNNIVTPAAMIRDGCVAGNVTRSCGEPIVKLPGFGMLNVLVAVCLLGVIYLFWRDN